MGRCRTASAIRSGFNDAAHVIEMHCDHAAGARVAGALTKENEAVDVQLSELKEMQRSQGQLFKNLVGLLDETRTTIRELHSITRIREK